MSEKMKLTWLGHSCFKVEYDNYSIIFDPYEAGRVPGLGSIDGESADEAICSHDHYDHNNKDGINLKGKKNASPFRITTLNTFHDDANGKKRGENKITIFECGEIRGVHFGDIGCDLTKQQMLIIGNPDVVLIPIGGYYTIDAEKAKSFVDVLKPRTVIPMHFRDDEAGFGFGEIGTAEDFTRLFSNDIAYRVNVTDDTEILISGDEVYNVTVLKPVKRKES